MTKWNESTKNTTNISIAKDTKTPATKALAKENYFVDGKVDLSIGT